MEEARGSLNASLYWCLGCGMVWAADEPPFCRHNIPPTLAHPARRMESLPTWHPFHPEAQA